MRGVGGVPGVCAAGVNFRFDKKQFFFFFREITLEVLGQEPVGAFMVRESTSKPGCYALSLRVPRDFQPSGIAHYLIMRTMKGYKIKVRRRRRRRFFLSTVVIGRLLP